MNERLNSGPYLRGVVQAAELGKTTLGTPPLPDCLDKQLAGLWGPCPPVPVASSHELCSVPWALGSPGAGSLLSQKAQIRAARCPGRLFSDFP